MKTTVQNWKAVESDRIWLSLNIKNESEPAEMVISGQIGKNWWDNSGVSAKEFRDALTQVPRGQKINLRINSEGGSVQDGLDIYNAIKARAGDVTAHITGYAVSIASVIPLAASRVISPVSSVWMIHEPWSMTQGDAEEHMRAAEMLDKHGDMLAEIYSNEIGKSKTEMRDAMKKETWFTGSEACDFGLADETSEADCSDCYSALYANVKNFRNVPQVILNLLTPKVANFQPAAGKQNNNQQNTNNMPEPVTPPAAAAAPAVSAADFTALQAQIANLTKSNLTARVERYVTENKITKSEVGIFVEAALKDEVGTFKILDEKPAAAIGGEPAASGIVMRDNAEPFGIAGKATEKLRNLFQTHNGDKAKCYAAMKADWNLLLNDAIGRDRVRNENSFSSSLTTNFLILGATTAISPKFASIKMFSRDTSVDPYKPLATGVMKFNSTAQDGSTTLTNATNFESGDSTITPVNITVSQYTESFHLRNTDLNSGIRMEDLVVAKMASLGSKISKVLAANITAANFSTLAPIIASPTAFGFNDMAIAWGALKKATRKNLMLDGPYLARIINTPTLFQSTPVVPGAGWKNVNGWDYVALHTEWSAAGNNIIGFAADPQAIGTIAGLPLIDSPAIPGGILAQATGMVEGIDLPIAVYSWFNTSTRTYWASFDLMFGANALDTTAGLVISSGTPS